MSSQKRLIDALPPSKRQKPMEILALGFSRTGTWSLKTALEKLGHSVYHMSECVPRWKEGHLHLWEEAMKAKLLGEGEPWTGDDIDKVLQNYTAVEDIPCILFVDELLEKYPNAKIILTNRDIDSWERSMRQTFGKILEGRSGWFGLEWLASIDENLWRPYLALLTMSVDHWTKGNLSNSSALRQSYINHYTSIRSKVPPSRLLEFESKDGWEPLCKFLGKPVPEDLPYPRVNDAKFTVNLHRYIYWIRVWGIFRMYIISGVVLILAIAVGWWKVG